MQEILNKYKERLINISGRNRSLVMKRIYKKNSFDLFKLKKFDAKKDEEILDFIINRKSDKCNIICDPYKLEEQQTKEVTELLKKEFESKVPKLLQKEKDKEKLKEKIENLNKEYNDKLQNEIQKIKKKTEEIIDYSQNIKYLTREIKSIEKETGRYELYIGYPFVEGYLKDKTFVKAPLMLYPISVDKKGDNWYIENIKEHNVILNKVFLLAFSKYNGVSINDIETEFENLKEANLNNIDGIIKYLKQNDITIKCETEEKVQKFVEHKSGTPIEYSLGELVIKPYLVLGQFPTANSIYNDYIALAKEKVENNLLKKLLINDERNNDNPHTGELCEERQKIREEDFYFLTPLDFSQEKAVKMVNSTDELVVYGPPGTGKSQTIANMISDGLAKGKKILMVSQKRAALDVIYNRIADINSKVVLLHDANKDKKEFYGKLAKQLEDILESNTNDQLGKIKEKALSVDSKIKILDDLGELLHKKRDFGLTLQEMYSKSKKISSKQDIRYEDFKNFRRNKEFDVYKYEELLNGVKEISAKGIIDNYRSYRKYLNNEAILKIREDIDCFEIEEFIDTLDDIKKKYNGKVKLSLSDIEYVDRLLELYINNEYNVTENHICELSKTINNDLNNELLKKLNDGRWWSISYWINYNKNKIKEQENAVEYEKRGREIHKTLAEYNDSIRNFIYDIDFIKNIVVPQEFKNYIKILLSKEDLTEYINNLGNALENYEEYRDIITGLTSLSDIQMKVLQYAYEHSNSKEHMVILLGNIPEFAVLVHINNIESSERDKLERYKEFYDITKEINNLMMQKQTLIPEHILNKWNSRAVTVSKENAKIDKELRRQASKKRALWPIRKYVCEFQDILFDVFPCWLLSPETVSQILPLAEGMFDLIIFDEASQMYVENAIPTIYRGKSVIIAGDDKQLRPSSTFKVKIDDNEEYDDIEVAAALEEESLLDLAKINYDSVHLNYHYRSKYDELINFSNYAFYGGRLEVSPNITRTDCDGERPIDRIKVDGTWIKRQNIKEAEKVVELVDYILKNRKNKETIGIITFNITQRDLIDDMLDHRASNDIEFKTLYYNESERVEGNEDVSIFVKNIENVQGDERDIIIFSTGYAQNENGRVSVNFGSLSQDGGENRLNVAISRAKKKIYVVTSIEPEVLNVENAKNNGPKLFKKYLQYVREVSDGNKESANSILNSLLDSDVSRNENLIFDSDFEMQVYDKISALGYDIDTQVGVSGYRIDLAVYDKKSSKYILGIECDGAAYHSSKNARERDIHRQRYLESRGWKIKRIWSKDWWQNPNKEIRKIQEYLKQI